MHLVINLFYFTDDKALKLRHLILIAKIDYLNNVHFV